MPPEITVPAPADALSWRQRLRRLPGRSPTLRLSRATVSARLWTDDAQLVQETVRSYTQEIQRFAFGDIQAIQIRRTVRGLVYNVTLVVCLALSLIGLVAMLADRGESFGDKVAFSVVTGVLALLLLVNIVRGPTCHTVLLTALGPQRLFSLSRMRQARRALDTIIARIDAVQGALRPDEAARQVDQSRAQQGPPPAPRPETTLPGYHY